MVRQCELDIMFNIDRAHFLIDEMVCNGHVVETNKSNILRPVALVDRSVANAHNQ
jgi:AP-4 complex subunit sigma-1